MSFSADHFTSRLSEVSVIVKIPSGMPNDLGMRDGLDRVAASCKRGIRAFEDPGK
jgi:hypothetical protein